MAQKTATLHTNHGDIVLNLFGDQAPKTVDNFVGLASGTKEYADPETGAKTTGKFYDGLTFHRVIDGFMIQGGCPLGTGTGGPGYKFADEFHPGTGVQQAVPAGHGQRRPGHQRLAVLHHRSVPRRTSTGGTPSSARWPTRPAATWSTRSARSGPAAMTGPAKPVVIESVDISE